MTETLTISSLLGRVPSVQSSFPQSQLKSSVSEPWGWSSRKNPFKNRSGHGKTRCFFCCDIAWVPLTTFRSYWSFMSRGHLVESTTSRQMAWKSQAHNKPFTKHEPYNICHIIYAIYVPYITEQLHFRPKSTIIDIIAISDQQSHRSASLKLLRDSSRPHLNVYCDIYHCVTVTFSVLRASAIRPHCWGRHSIPCQKQVHKLNLPCPSKQLTRLYVIMANG